MRFCKKYGGGMALLLLLALNSCKQSPKSTPSLPRDTTSAEGISGVIASDSLPSDLALDSTTAVDLNPPHPPRLRNRFPRRTRRLDSLRIQLARWPKSQYPLARATVDLARRELAAALQQTDSTGTDPFRLDRRLKTHLDQADELIAHYRAGRHPIRSLRGDYRLAYPNPGGGLPHPFRVYIPSHRKAVGPGALVIALHGRSGDEHYLFDVFRGRGGGGSILQREARAFSYVVATPRGGGPGISYTGAAAEDVLAVTHWLQKTWEVPASKTFLMGHSMGGGGTMLVGLRHPTRYRALAPIGGGMRVAPGLQNLPAEATQIPVQFFQGADDFLVPVTTTMLAHTREVLPQLDYVELPGKNHSSVFQAAVPLAFQFFRECNADF